MEMRRTYFAFAFAAALGSACCPSLLLADAVVLKDGTRVEGDVKRTETGYTVTSTTGKSVDVGINDVQSIEVDGGKTTDATSASNLASLRRSVEVLTSPATVLERYRRFLDQNRGTASIEDAKRDMVTWQDRLDRGLVKVGTQWVTPAQKQEMTAQATSIAQSAIDLVKQDRITEAEPIIQQALDSDPQNPTALYLHGLVLVGQDQVVAARKAFEAVVAVLADHAPSFNNLGVILWKQNQQMGAIKYYEQAMIDAPVNKVILDNVAEAFAALPDDQRKNPLAVRVFKLFSAQDQQLQAIMAQSGWFRWGSTWVDQPTLDKLKAAEQAIKDKLDKLSADIGASKGKIADINTSIDANNRSMTQMQANSFARDAKGSVYQLPLPDSYYTMQSDNEKLTADRAREEASIQSMIDQGRKARQSLPVPQFTGVQHLIGTPGTPLPPPPSTAPTTDPSLGSRTDPTAPATSAPAAPPVLMPLP
jgi:tetratricopeptide (TPR) repeat protein